MIEIVPAILPESLEDLRIHLQRVNGIVSRVQIDVVDGVFAPTKTWPYTSEGKEEMARFVAEEEGLPLWDSFDFEIDMMVAKPEEAIEQWARAGATAVVVHIESTKNHSNILQNIRMNTIEIGWAKKPATPMAELFTIIESAGIPDFIQLMGNDNIGRHGVTLDPKVYGDIAEIRKYFPSVTIAVDIGVNENTASQLMKAGANKLVIGSALFNAPNIRERIEKFKNLKI